MAYQQSPTLLKKDILAEKLEQIEFELLSFGYWQQEETAVQKNDILSHYKLVCITQGSCTVSASGKDYFLNAGDSILIAPFVVYSALCTSKEPVEFYDFHFLIGNINGQAVFTDLFHCKYMTLFPKSIPPHSVPMLHLSYSNLAAAKPGYYYSTKLSFLRIILSLLTTTPNYELVGSLPHHTLGKEQTVGACVEYMNRHMTEAVTVEQLCRTMHVSQSYLYQCFTSITGLSTKEFITTNKLKMVELELKHSNHSVRDITEAFGFSSIYALSSQFKKYYGLSPLQYRKRNLVGAGSSSI